MALWQLAIAWRRTKGAILSLLRDSYVHRDSVGLIVFRKDSAEVLLPFTRSVERAERLLATLPTGGKTPLAQGLRVAYTMCDRLLRRHSAERIQMICITDGRATSGASEVPCRRGETMGSYFRDLASRLYRYRYGNGLYQARLS